MSPLLCKPLFLAAREWVDFLFGTAVRGERGVTRGGAGTHRCEGEGRGSLEPPTCPRCECAPGYVGSNCSEDFDDCQDHRCQNNARCLDEVNGYSCLCTEGYRYHQEDKGHLG